MYIHIYIYIERENDIRKDRHKAKKKGSETKTKTERERESARKDCCPAFVVLTVSQSISWQLYVGLSNYNCNCAVFLRCLVLCLD